MKEPCLNRPLTHAERERIDHVLLRLRAHFREWSDQYQGELELIQFAVYEGCNQSPHCYEILVEAAPLALGKQLVERAEYSWVMVQADAGWELALTHDILTKPILLASIIRGEWNHERYDEPPDKVEVTIDSYETLAALSQA